MAFSDATIVEVNKAVMFSQTAFRIFRKTSLKQRADFLRAIASKLKKEEAALIEVANAETHLGEARLKTELNRTAFQLNSYADACERGDWLEIRIDTADPNRNPPKLDIRKMLVPLGPVVVFGASNFPFAYSTAGGDTACALAAGCTVIVKAHPAHAATSEMVAQAINAAAIECRMPEAVFIHLHGSSFEVGKVLVQHPLVKAVGFTGSFEGGKALFDLANRRENPIPVFAEMGSVNPVFILPRKLKTEADAVAAMCASSITMSAGQFCTNPGIMVGIKGEELERFKEVLGKQIKKTARQKMLHKGIAENFLKKRNEALHQNGIAIVAETETEEGQGESIPTIASVDATIFLGNPLLHKEVFGPYSLLVECKNSEEMISVAEAMEGQLTCTLIGNAEELKAAENLMDVLEEKCGRFILNGVPTGVEVVLSMHHGGPYPATTDSRFTSVGADGIKRFARPISFQNWDDELLPEELKKENPLALWRTVNNELAAKKI